ncbi:MAG TPA: hypothetical protein VGF88_09205 [Acidobacteriaceae bacterium]|jgi:hypothetical protein
MHVSLLPISSVSELTRSTVDIDAELFSLHALANQTPVVTELGQPITPPR